MFLLFAFGRVKVGWSWWRVFVPAWLLYAMELLSSGCCGKKVALVFMPFKDAERRAREVKLVLGMGDDLFPSITWGTHSARCGYPGHTKYVRGTETLPHRKVMCSSD